ncbi:regulatory signaling modulator protein AmpE [Sulfurivermis fontis]|uniref:regulatory signaling modulator protein AmpE n=1 Tax=Sulfurivermis fontis TaxID=1972068 RepID=UPI000FDB0FEC|nr:regulatory signaling modulator protein AmpE [Sulfurivermis fontis]
MALLTILLCVFLERLLGSLEEMRRFGWLDLLMQQVRRQPWADGPAGVAVVVLIPVLTVLLLGVLFHAIGWPLFFLFAVLVLLYSFGPRDLEAEVEAFLEARERGDEESAMLYAGDMLGNTTVDSSGKLTRVMLETMLAEANERFFGVVLWFILLGPVGALLYRVAVLVRRGSASEASGFAAAAQRLHQILAWLPARLTALAYALSGSFVDAMHYWREEAGKWLEDSRFILVASGFGALRYQPAEDDGVTPDLAEEDSYIREALALIRRAALVWLVVLAVFTLAGAL